MPVLSGGSANVAFLSTGSGGLKIADTMALPHRFHEHRSEIARESAQLAGSPPNAASDGASRSR